MNIKPKLKPVNLANPAEEIEKDKNEKDDNNNETESVVDETPNETPNETPKIRIPVDDPKSLLLPYQIPHVDSLAYSLNMYGRVLDASDTGTGKTYSAVATCMLLKLKPLIICPKSVLSSWKKALDYFGAQYYGLSNYETIQNCKYYTANSGNTKVLCNFIEKENKDILNNTANTF